MSWPVLSDCIKSTDLSRYQNWADTQANRVPGRIDWDWFKARNPEVRLVIIRAAGSRSGIDPDFAYNFDEASRVGYDVAIYVNNSPTQQVAALSQIWRAAVGSRAVKCAILDAETTDGQSPQTCTVHTQACDAEMRMIWPDAEVVCYSAAWWWNPNIVHGWEGSWKFWLAHYPFFVQEDDGEWRVAFNFAEADRCLPIGNAFTPRLGTGITISQVVGWQFTDKAIMEVITRPVYQTPRADLDYFLRSWYERVYKPNQPPTPPSPVPVEIRYPTGAVALTVVET